MLKTSLSLLLIIIKSCLCFIFLNSAKSSESSHDISKRFAELILPYVNVGQEWENRAAADNIVRKCAHFAEYFSLSVILFSVALLLGDKARRVLLVVFCIALLIIPIVDESLQLLSDRTSSALDIGIDIAGSAVGALMAFLVSKIIKKSHRK